MMEVLESMSKECKEIRENVQRLKEILEKAKRDLKDCRNELCLKCGNYKQAHNGACDGCRWRNV